jgi:hypothetical protein
MGGVGEGEKYECNLAWESRNEEREVNLSINNSTAFMATEAFCI